MDEIEPEDWYRAVVGAGLGGAAEAVAEALSRAEDPNRLGAWKLARLTGFHYRAIVRALDVFVDGGWLAVTEEPGRCPVVFVVPMAGVVR